MSAAEPVLAVDHVTRRYRLPRQSLLARAPLLTAVDDASFVVRPGEVLGIIGESGSGKSTLARMVMGFERPDVGGVRFQGHSLGALDRQTLRRLRPRLQMVFQDPFGSLDPRRTIGWSIAEPLLQNRAASPATRRLHVAAALEAVGLRQSDMARYPHEFSGGQRQRIAIARAIVTKPALLVADEPVASLDVSVQAQILNLLMELQDEMGLSILFISHDLAVVANLCDRLLVMRQGRIVEQGATCSILAAPKHPYTKSLFATAMA